LIVVDTGVLDVDVARWLLGAEVAAAQVLTPRRNSRAAGNLQDPLIVLLEMSSGVLVDIEVLINSGYGYDIRGEVVGETGTVELAETAAVVVKRDGGFRGRVPADWQERFARAYDAELQDWIDAALAGIATGPSSWDGYAATAATNAGVQALHSGTRVEVSMRPQPDLYRPAAGAAGPVA
jgi:myo-inositol 2-dehydrogenase / D-chiro-inositol 1-dehydrogenase